MASKRPHEDGPNGAQSSKRPRSNEPSPAPNGTTTAPSRTTGDQLEAAKAAAKARAAAARERKNATAATTTATPSPAEAARARIEEMKARVAAATARASASSATPSAPNATAPPERPAANPFQPPQDQDDFSQKSKGGLGIGLHPALLANDSNQASTSRNKGPIPSRFSTAMGNRRQQSPASTSNLKSTKQLDLTAPTLDELKQNPYFDPNVGGGLAAAPRNRKSRDLLFHQKGKFIAQAQALRRTAQMEEMKRRIAESTRKAGLDEDRSEQAFLVPEPPALEWWDEDLVAGDSYPDFENEDPMQLNQLLKITTEESPVNHYIQHPVLLEPPQEKNMPAPKPMFMTKEEQAKKRRQNRTEDRKEKQAKVRLGLEPPEPPKVKKTNLMRVLGEQAVKDPTAVEARVNREIAERKEKHEQTNHDRQLTKEQRHEKLASNQQKDAAKGVLVNVYRIDSLAYGKHRYLIDVNAKQNALTGITIMNPKFNIVIVEGGQYSIAKYKKLMLQRIRWSENAPTTEAAQESLEQYHKDIAEASFLQPQDEGGQLKDQTDNRCDLIWEGQEKARAFNKWSSKVCETDADARRTLEKAKMENMWQLAKGWSAS